MNRYAIVKDGVVINTIIVNEEIPDFIYSQGDLIPDPDELSGTGMTWDGSNFINPNV